MELYREDVETLIALEAPDGNLHVKDVGSKLEATEGFGRVCAGNTEHSACKYIRFARTAWRQSFVGQ